MTTFREKLAWAAALFDGEGYAGCANTKQGAGLRLTVTQKYPELLERFQRSVGCGYVAFDGRIWRYYANSKEAFQAVMAALWLFLGSRKRAQLKEAWLKWNAHPRTYRRRHAS